MDEFAEYVIDDPLARGGHGHKRLAAAPARDEDGVDRRGFLKCMAWAGTGLVWTVSGGVLSSCTLGASSKSGTAKGDFTFAQVSDSHIGFSKAPNTDVTGTLQKSIDKINALATRPAFVLHTGDLSHLSTPQQFDTVDQILKGAKSDTGRVFYTPGEHDTFVDNGKTFMQRFGQGTQGNGWQSAGYKGVHIVGLVNTWNVKGGGFGVLGQEQLDWLKQDLAGVNSDTPLIVFAHVPLWAIYPQWGWGTDDAEQALSMMRRFSSVTVLNGHIHQVLEKQEGNITFHTAASTAYPQPAPGQTQGPGPLVVVTNQLQSALGVREVAFSRKQNALVVIDQRLG
ncbi:MAG TPA: metallophosphoesterase [Dehalococcoidia bacterium]|nr:metallophosphoesterase [Dehalococcoidia bacterium]